MVSRKFGRWNKNPQPMELVEEQDPAVKIDYIDYANLDGLDPNSAVAKRYLELDLRRDHVNQSDLDIMAEIRKDAERNRSNGGRRRTRRSSSHKRRTARKGRRAGTRRSSSRRQRRTAATRRHRR